MKKVACKIKDLVTGKGAEALEVAVISSRNSSVEAKELKENFVTESDSLSYALRVLKNGRMGYAYSMSDDSVSLESMVDGALFATTCKERDVCAILPQGPFTYGPLENECQEEPVSLQEKIDFAVALEKGTRDTDRRIKNVRYATLRESLSTFYIFNSLGVEGEYSRSLYMAFVYAVAEEKEQSETGFGFAFKDTYMSLRGEREKISAEGAGKALRMLGAKRISTGRYPVVIENSAMTELLEVLSPSFNGKNVALKKSMVASSMGKEIFARDITLIDDPLMAGGAGSAPFDGEGIPGKRLTLVNEGVLTSFLTDSYWGKRLATGSSGSLRRGAVTSPPGIGSSNIYILPGIHEADSLVSEVDKGVLLTGFMGIHTADTVSGDFSVGASGIYIEKGELSYPVRTFAVSGNILELMKRVSGVGKDLEMFGSSGSPTVAFEFMDIGGE